MHRLASLASAFIVLSANAGCAASVSGTPAFELHGDEFDRVRGEYALADGRRAHLVGTRRHPRLEVDDGSSRVLRALSATEFVSKDGCDRVMFEAHANASVTRLRITSPTACAAR
jgi:hypothetical protein